MKSSQGKEDKKAKESSSMIPVTLSVRVGKEDLRAFRRDGDSLPFPFLSFVSRKLGRSISEDV